MMFLLPWFRRQRPNESTLNSLHPSLTDGRTDGRRHFRGEQGPLQASQHDNATGCCGVYSGIVGGRFVRPASSHVEPF